MAQPEKIIHEIIKAVKKVPVDRLGEVLQFLNVLSRDPVELSPEELEEIKKARQEIAEGKFVTLEELEGEL